MTDDMLNQEQQTRVVPAVSTQRHRRADRYRTQEGTPAPTATRVSVQPPVQQEAPSQGVPRPATLQHSNAYRPHAPTSETPRVRRPVRIEEPELSPAPPTPPPFYEKKRRRWPLVLLVALVILLALLVAGMMLLPEDDSTLGQMKATVVATLQGLLPSQEAEPVSTAQALDFSAAPTQGTVPLDVAFTLTTTKTVSAVRVVDESGNVLPTSTSVSVDNADSRSWMLNLSLAEGYSGMVLAQIQDGEAWLDTDKSLMLDIQPQEIAAFAPETTTAEPTEAPTMEPTQVPAAAEDAQEMAVTATPTIAPTDIPTMEPTEEPTPVPTEEPTPEPTEEPTPEPTRELVAQAVEAADPTLVSTSVIYNGKTKLSTYDRAVADIINMPAADAYTTLPYGVMTYRGNAFRQNAAVGNVGDICSMEVLWTVEAGSVKGKSKTFYGIGWGSQPAIVKWSKEVRLASNIVEEKKNVSALKEVIVAGLDGNIYFLDLADGQATRETIALGYPMRSTPSIHPLGYPIMTVGQYARQMAKGNGKIGLRFYNLLTQEEVYRIDGLDSDLKRPYYEVGAFDTSALIDPVSDTLITAGTNGMVYLTKLNTTFDYNAGTITIEPESIVMKSKKKNQADKTTAVESSVAAYGHYMFYADLSGLLRCVDTSTLETMWAVDTGDKVEAAIALDLDDAGDLWLYTANTLQNRSKGDVTIRCFNAMTGEEAWALAVGSQKNSKTEKVAGAMASPVVGQNQLGDLVYFTLSYLSDSGAQAVCGDGVSAVNGAVIAINKQTGQVAWAKAMDSYCYASPVAVYAEDGKGWIIQASSSGKLYLLDGLSGETINTLQVEGTIEGSPAVYGNTLVIGTTGKNTSYIYGITLD